MDPEQLERARVICEALSSMPGFSATLTQQPTTHSAPAHTFAAQSTSAQPQSAPQTTHTPSAAAANTQPRRGATQSAPRGGIPAALSRYRAIKPKPAPHTSTSAAPSPVPSNAAPPLFPALPGLPSIPAGPLPPLPPPPPVPAHTVLPLATGHGPFGLLAPFTTFAPPAMSGQLHAPLAMSAHGTMQLHGTAQVPPPPAPAASTLPPAPVPAASSIPRPAPHPPATSGEALTMLPRRRPAASQAQAMESVAASTTASGGHAAAMQAGLPLDLATLPAASTEANKHRKRPRSDEALDAPVTKRAATEERRQTLALDSTESSSSVGPRVQSRNKLIPQQHSHALQISPPPQATGSAPTDGNNAADTKGKGRAVPRQASPEPAQGGLNLPPGGSVRRAVGAAQAASAPAPAPAPAPAAAPAPAQGPAPAPAVGLLALAAAGGVRGTTVERLAAVKRTTAAPQPGSRGAQPPAAPAGPSGNAAAGSRPRASASAVASAGPSHPPAAQVGAAAADDEDEDEDEETDEDEEQQEEEEEEEEKGGRKKANKKPRVVNQATNAQASLQVGLKWYSWMAPN